MAILVGCSGWYYDDCVGGFYPIELANKNGQWFDYRAQHFNTVESTALSKPLGNFQVNTWMEKAKDKKGFEYSVKVPQLVTHKALVEGDEERAIFLATSLRRPVKPLAEADLLARVVAALSLFQE